MKNIQLDHGHHLAVNKKYPICYLAHDIDGPRNIGSLFRIADALGVERMYLSGRSTKPPHRKIRKTSMATEKIVSFTYVKNPIEVVQMLRTDGYKIISLEKTSASIDVLDLSVAKQEKMCLILGSENRGVNQELLDLSDMAIHIKMAGQKSSMNVAAACSIATFEIIRRLNS